MARAGYDPRAAVEFWTRFKAVNDKSGNKQWEFLSTHPLDETRIKALEAEMPAALAEYQKHGGH
jgi:metalloendopeptidase OMA1, mitochondrial